MGRDKANRKQKDLVSFGRGQFAVYADIYAPAVQQWMTQGAFEKLDHDHLYLTADASEAKNVIKRMLTRGYKALILCGDDAAFERFINHYRSLVPNPAHQLPFGIVAIGESQFAKKYQIDIPNNRLALIERFSFSKSVLRLLEIDSSLALYAHFGLRSGFSNPANLLPQSLRSPLQRSPFSRPIPRIHKVLCVNDAPRAYQIQAPNSISVNNVLHERHDKEEVLFEQRLLSVSAYPIMEATKQDIKSETRNPFFRLDCRALPSLRLALLPLQSDMSSYLCQRIRLSFTPEVSMQTAAIDTPPKANVSISLSSREFYFLMPRQLKSAIDK